MERIRTSKPKYNEYFLKYDGIFKRPEKEKADQLILSMESGCCTLDDILAMGKRYTCSELLFVIPQLVEAFAVLEENGIANRDVKPQNIILVEKKNKEELGFYYKISDFGIGCSLSVGQLKVPLESLIGYTKRFVAPEILCDSETKKNYDPFLADSFSLGLVILRMINKGWGQEILDKLFEDPKLLKEYEEIRKPLKGMLEINVQQRWRFGKVLKYFEENKKKFCLKKEFPKEEHKFYQNHVINLEKSDEDSIETLKGYFENHKNLFQAYNNQVTRPEKAKFHLDRAWDMQEKINQILEGDPQTTEEEIIKSREREMFCLNSYADWHINMGNLNEAEQKLKTSGHRCRTWGQDELKQANTELEQQSVVVDGEDTTTIPIKKYSSARMTRTKTYESDSYNLWGKLSMNRGNLDEAERFYQDSLKAHQDLYGEDHQEIAPCLNNLGNVYYHKGNYKKAEECFERSIHIYKEYYGENHAAIATAMCNIGMVNKMMGNLKKAEDFYKKSLEIQQNLFGENHLSIATSLNNLGELYESLDLTISVDYYLKSLKIRENLLEKNHSDIADSLNNLGGVYLKLENWPKAEEYFWNSLDIYKGLFDENHPLVATSYNNLGYTYKNWKLEVGNKYDKAEECYLKSLKIYQSLFGENHLSVANAFNNLGNLYKVIGNIDKALEYYQKNLEIRERISGRYDNSVANAYHVLGYLYRKKGDLLKSEENIAISLEIKKSIHGESHSDVADSYNDMGYLHQKLKDFTKAEEFYGKALEINRSIYGESHSSVEKSYNNLGGLFKEKGDYMRADDFTQKSDKIRQTLFYSERVPRHKN